MTSTDHGFVALSQFQGALAVLVRLARIHALPVDRSESLANALTAIPLRDGWYEGGVARWLRGPLAQALELPGDHFDSQLTAALAGASSPSSVRDVRVVWEGHAYRIDLAAPERQRLDRIREKSHRCRSTSCWRSARSGTSSRPSIDVNGVGTVLSRLRALPKLATNQAANQVLPPKVDPSRPPAEILAKAVEDLSTIIRPKDLKRAELVSRLLNRLVDRLLADSLRSLAYALDLGDAEESVISGVDVSARHDFGFGLPAHDARVLAPWAEPQRQVEAGVPWRLRGSLLNLDVPLSPFALRRVSGPRLGQPVLQLEAKTFALSATAMNASDLRDEDRDRIAEAIQKGRERVISLSSGSLSDNIDVLRGEALTDGWRRRAVQWALEHHADPTTYLSLAELLQLGRGGVGTSLDTWGPSAWPGDTCLCTRLNLWNNWMLLAGRPRLGLLATEMPDLNLRVAVALHDLKLPAVLAKDILLAATLDYIETVAPTDNGDWLTLVRSGRPSRVSGLTTTLPRWPLRVHSCLTRPRGRRSDEVTTARDGSGPPRRVGLGADAIDSSARQLRILSPAADMLVSGPTTIRIAIEPAGAVGTVVFFADGRQICSVTAAPLRATGMRCPPWSPIRFSGGHLGDGERLVETVRTRDKPTDIPIFSVGVDAVPLTVTVSDGKKRFVRGLMRSAFHVFEDGVPQQIEQFWAEGAPLELVVAVDVSASMAPAMPALKSAVKQFMQSLPPDDPVTLLAFNHNIFELANPSTPPEARLDAIDRLTAGGADRSTT
jgi:hypothetical protein